MWPGFDLPDLTEDRQRRDALLWNFTVLGEAASRVTGEVKQRFPDLPREQPVRLRNRIVHGYWSIDLEVLHTTANERLPDLADQLRGVLGVLESESAATRSPPGECAAYSATLAPTQETGSTTLRGRELSARR